MTDLIKLEKTKILFQFLHVRNFAQFQGCHNDFLTFLGDTLYNSTNSTFKYLVLESVSQIHTSNWVYSASNNFKKGGIKY